MILRRCIYCKLQAERRFGPIHHIYVRSHLRATRRGLIEGQLDEIEMDVLFMKHNGETIIKTDGDAVRSIISKRESSSWCQEMTDGTITRALAGGQFFPQPPRIDSCDIANSLGGFHICESTDLALMLRCTHCRARCLRRLMLWPHLHVKAHAVRAT